MHKSGVDALRDGRGEEGEFDVVGPSPGSLCYRLELQSIQKRRHGERLDLFWDIEYAGLLRHDRVSKPVSHFCDSLLAWKSDNLSLWPGSRLDCWLRVDLGLWGLKRGHRRRVLQHYRD